MRQRLVHRRLLTVVFATVLAHAPVALASEIVVISDLHLGFGRDCTGNYAPSEDFRWTEDFKAFLDAISKSSHDATTLVLAGDTFELWENDLEHCNAGETVGCSADEIAFRLSKIFAAHDDEIQALKTFARRGANQVVVIPGNHDAGILFPTATDAILEQLGRQHVSVATDGSWIGEARVLVEHGHQVDAANSFPSWPRPYKGTPARLERPFGEQFVREFFTPQEQRFANIDNFTSATAGVSYARRTPDVSIVSTAGRFLSFFLRDLALEQKITFLGNDGDAIPEWNLEATKVRSLSFLVDSVADAPEKELLKSAFSADDAETLTKEDLKALCDSRYLKWVRDGKPAGYPLCEAKTLQFLAAQGVQLVLHRDLQLERHLRDLISTLRSDGKLQGDVIYVHGHTHAARAPAPGPIVHLTIANSGAWQRMISPGGVAALGIPPSFVLTALTLDRLPACYPFIRIVGPTTTLEYWTKEKKGYSLQPACKERE